MFEGNEIDISFSKKKEDIWEDNTKTYSSEVATEQSYFIYNLNEIIWNAETPPPNQGRGQTRKKKVVTAEIETLFCATIWYQSFCSHDKYKIKNKRGGSQIVWFLPFILLLPFHHLHEFLYFQLENYWFHHLSLGGKYCHTIFQRNMALEKKK